MAIPPKKKMVGLGIQGFGNLMLVERLLDSTSIRSMIDFCISLLEAMCLINYLNFLVQDPSTPPTKRIWTSIDNGTKIFFSAQDEVA